MRPARSARKKNRHDKAWMLVGGSALVLIICAMAFSSLFGGSKHARITSTAFAAAPGGTYAVAVRPDDTVDIIDAVSTADGAAYEIARVPHLPGYTSFATVSPDARRLALVVADKGTVAVPIASLMLLDVETGAANTVDTDIDQLQTPVWSPDGRAVVTTSTTVHESGASDVTFLSTGLDGVTRTLGKVSGVAGAYPVAFDPQGRLFAVVIDGRGSTLLRDFAEIAALGSGVTRDWKLSPDGTQLAYLAASLDNGLEYQPRVAILDDAKGAVGEVQAATESAIGVAWETATEPRFGRTGEGSGFEVPLDYSPQGEFMALQKWTGRDLQSPGEMTLELRGPSGTIELDQYARFYGWARR